MRRSVEAAIWLAAAYLLLAQLGCVRTEAVSSREIHLPDVTFTPEFVTERQSLPAQVRYWVAADQRVTVTWAELRVKTDSVDCDLCEGAASSCRVEFFPVSVRHRVAGSASSTEDARFDFPAGCAVAPDGTAVFTPTETGEYLGHVVLPGQPEPIPSEPGAWFPINVLRASFTLPPRLLQPTASSDAWEWSARGGTTALKEAFDPRLHVGRVRILVGTCNAPAPPAPRDDECGMDGLMDPAFTMERFIAPHYVRVQNQGVSVQECRGVAGDDGNIDFGPNPDGRTSPCRPHGELVLLTPTYLSAETAAGRPHTWRVEFSEADGFPPPGMGTQIWIEFTLVPGP